MHHRFISAFVLMSLFLLSGCTRHYVIATKEGQMLLAQGKPALDPATGLLSYTDEDGTSHQIRHDDVSQVIER
ncbi:YgdI/YgdR family lipoprotein [Dickeya lacustris]|uniref:YgdI/YgdR family lipoprotein n=1 Tax=Dickeya lacustris TaxID=2259638 RepID=A0ABY8G5K8_9GAMM|nr:YgdI/YgdR family lipoprotein [Dickeya lacustris]WFN55214.1 YgdI/YgdR family lipoprotein [Dickeya lacustris]